VSHFENQNRPVLPALSHLLALPTCPAMALTAAEASSGGRWVSFLHQWCKCGLGGFQKSEPLGFTGLGTIVGRFHPFGTISFSQSLGKMRLGTIWVSFRIVLAVLSFCVLSWPDQLSTLQNPEFRNTL